MRQRRLVMVLVVAACGSDDSGNLTDAATGGGDETSWAIGFGGMSTNERPDTIAVDPSRNIFVGSKFGMTVDFTTASYTAVGTDDAALTKLSPDGVPLWTRHIASPGFYPNIHGLVAMSDGSVVVTGMFEQSTNLGGTTLTAASPGPHDAYIARFSGDNQHMWSTKLDYPGGPHVYGLAQLAPTDLRVLVDSDAFQRTQGLLLVQYSDTGQKGIETVVATGAGWAWGPIVTPTGTLLVIGSFYATLVLDGTTYTGDASDFFIAEVSASGEILRTRVFQHPEDQTIKDALVRSDGSVLLVGEREGVYALDGHTLPEPYMRPLIIELDASWNTTRLGTAELIFDYKTVASVGDQYLMAHLGGLDRLDANLVKVAGYRMPTMGSGEVWDVVVEPEGSVIMAGQYQGELMLGSYQRASVGTGYDIVITKRPPP